MESKRTVDPLLQFVMEIVPLALFMIVIFYIPNNATFLHRQFPTIVCEAALILALSLLYRNKRRIAGALRKNKLLRKLSALGMSEFFYLSKILRNALLLHLLIILVYELLPGYCHSSRTERIIMPGVLLLLLVAILAFELIRLALINRKMRSEDWLPIINETGSVVGKVALSISQTSGESYLHPIVRIALIYKGLLYLKERPARATVDPHKLDYPFEKLVFYRHTLEEVVGNALEKGCGNRNLPVKFVFRYHFSKQNINRLIYLYTCRIDNESLLNSLHLKNGKFWPERQIEENLGLGVFSECFEKEYEILKETVLLAEKVG